MDKSENYDGFELLEQSLMKVSVEKESGDEKQKKELSGKAPKKEKKVHVEDAAGSRSEVFQYSLFFTREEHLKLRLMSFFQKKSISRIVREELSDYFSRAEDTLRKIGITNYETVCDEYEKVNGKK